MPKKKPSDLYNPQVELYAASFEPGEGKFPGNMYPTSSKVL
jgi:hypothetical protein